MKELILIAIGAALVNNVVLSQFLGICAFLGVSKKMDTAAGMGGAVIFVLTISSFVTSLIYKFILHIEIVSKGYRAKIDLSVHFTCSLRCCRIRCSSTGRCRCSIVSSCYLCLSAASASGQKTGCHASCQKQRNDFVSFSHWCSSFVFRRPSPADPAMSAHGPLFFI